jgi:hypothetical protein
MAYQSSHTGPEVDAAVQMLSQIQEARDATAQDRAEVQVDTQEVHANAVQVAGLASTVSNQAGTVQTLATEVEQAHFDTVNASEAALQARDIAVTSASEAQAAQASALASEQATATAVAQATDAADIVSALAPQVLEDAASAANSADSAAASAASAAAVVTGGTATLTPTPGKIPLADGGGKIAEAWMPSAIARTAAVTAATQAAALATERTAPFLDPADSNPSTRFDGSALEIGDRYFNTTAQGEYLFTSAGWVLNDAAAAVDIISDKISSVAKPSGIPLADPDGLIDEQWLPSSILRAEELATDDDSAKGAALIGYDQITVQAVLDDNRPLTDYAALIAYSGRAKTVRITNEGISGRFRNLGAAPGVPDHYGISFRANNGDLWKRVNAERVSVSWFGALGDGVTDDAPAFQRASNYLGAIGGGKAFFHQAHLIDTALSIGDYVSFEGDLLSAGELRYGTAFDYDSKKSRIVINPATTITTRSGSGFGGGLVMPKGLNLPFADATAAAAGVAAFAGTAFTVGGSDPYLHDMIILGFNKMVELNNFERPRFENLKGDNKNGIDLAAVYDIGTVANIHCWPFTTTHQSWTTGPLNLRPGFGFKFANVADMSNFTNCFAYGYDRGVIVDGCNMVNLLGFVADGYGAGASTAVGIELKGICKEINLIGCRLAAQGRSIVIDINAGGLNSTAAAVNITSCLLWDCDIKHIDLISGSANIGQNTFWKGPIGIDVGSAYGKANIDLNYFEDITGGAISSGSFDNLNIGPSNRFVNCVNSFGQRYVIDSNPTARLQYSGSTVGGIAVQPLRSRGTTAAKTAVVANDLLYQIDPFGHDGSGFISGGGIRQAVGAIGGVGNISTKWIFSARSAGAGSPVDRVLLDSDGGFKPVTDNAVTLGSSTQRWASVWSATGTIQTSDERTKLDIKDAELGLDFITALRPVSYRWKEGSVRVVRQVMLDEDGRQREEWEEGKETDLPGRVITESVPGTRTHWGLIAQEVQKVVSDAGVDFAGWVLSDPNDKDSQQALRYDQFISPLIKAAQELASKNKALEERLGAIEEKLAKL